MFTSSKTSGDVAATAFTKGPEEPKEPEQDTTTEPETHERPGG